MSTEPDRPSVVGGPAKMVWFCLGCGRCGEVIAPRVEGPVGVAKRVRTAHRMLPGSCENGARIVSSRCLEIKA